MSRMAFWRKKSNKTEAAPLPASKVFSELENDPYAETYEDANEWRASSSQVSQLGATIVVSLAVGNEKYVSKR